MSLIRSIVDSIARRLESADYLRTVPQIPVVVEDHKDVEASIAKAMQSAGAFCLVSFAGGDSDTQDTPGPYLTDTRFTVTVSEIPSVWRAKSGNTPSATEIAETVSRLIHHYQPTNKDGTNIAGASGVLRFESIATQPNDSFLQLIITFSFPLVLSNQTPTR